MNAQQILAKVASGELTADKAAELLNPITFKVSDKGAISVYGLQRFPVTLYKDQWETLLSKTDSLKQFIAQNQGRLVNKR